MLAEIEAGNFFETVGDVKGKALVDTLSDRLSEIVAKTRWMKESIFFLTNKSR